MNKKTDKKENKRSGDKSGVYFSDIIFKIWMIIIMSFMMFSHLTLTRHSFSAHLFPYVEFDDDYFYEELYENKYNETYDSLEKFINYVKSYNNYYGSNSWMYHEANGGRSFNLDLLNYSKDETLKYLKETFNVHNFTYWNIPNSKMRMRGLASPQFRVILNFEDFVENYNDVDYGIERRYIYIYVLTHEIFHLKLSSVNERYVDFESFKALWENDLLRFSAYSYGVYVKFIDEEFIKDYDDRYYINEYLTNIILT